MICPNCQADNSDASDSCFGCGKSLFSLTKGSLLGGRYLILSQLGRGGMGMVYKAQDQELEETVAIKVLRSDIAASSEVARRFRDEIRLARRVRHKNVCAIHEFGQDGHLRFIVMELVDGMDLRRVLRQSGRGLPWDAAYDIAIQVAHGLQAVHEVGIVHRDLKTPNIMRDKAGQVRLMDFGIAKSVEAGVSTGATATGQIIGTPEYMSPEQVRAEKLDARTDIYSLGIVAYELFTGAVPFVGDTPLRTLFMHLQDPPPLGAGCSLPEPLIPIIARALAKNRNERFAAASEMATALEGARALGHRIAVASHAAATMAIEKDVVFEGTESMSTPVPAPVPTPVQARTAPAPPAPRARSVTPTPTPRPQGPSDLKPAPPATAMPARRVTVPAPRPAEVVTRPPATRVLAGPSPSRGVLAAAILGGFVLLGALILWGTFRVQQQAVPPTPSPAPIATASIAATLAPSPVPGTTVPSSAVTEVATVPAPLRAPVPRLPRAGTHWSLSEAMAGLRFGWDAAAGASGYRVVLANGDRVVSERRLVGTSWDGPPLPAGTYQWRVAALDASGQAGQDSAFHSFVVVAAPPTTTLPLLALRPPPTTATPPEPIHPAVASPETALAAAVLNAQPIVPPVSPPASAAPRSAPAVPLRPGSLTVKTKPGARVVMDGKPIGATPIQGFAISPGRHQIVFQHPDYLDLKRLVEVKPGEAVALEVDLRDEATRTKH